MFLSLFWMAHIMLHSFFYNHFVGRVHDLESEMDRFASELTGIMRREIVGSQIEERNRP